MVDGRLLLTLALQGGSSFFYGGPALQHIVPEGIVKTSLAQPSGPAGEAVHQVGEAPGQQREPVLLGEAPVRAGEVALGQGGHLAGLQLLGVLLARPHPGQVVQHKPGVVTLGATLLTHKYLVPCYLAIGFTKVKFGFMVHCNALWR